MTIGLAADLTAVVGSLTLAVRLELPAPSTVGILGPNGAGKTTLLRILAGLHPLRSGTVHLEGTILDDVGAGVHVMAEHRPVGFVFQDHLLFPHLSVLENVAFGLRSRGAGRAAARAEASSWIERVGLADRARDRPGTLSGGEVQRVALARALAVRPRLLLLDEPMGALDATTRSRTRRDLTEVLAGHDGMRIIVTHDPLEAMAVADHLVVLEHGRVVQEGTSAQLVARPASAYVADLVGLNLLLGRRCDGGVVVADHPTISLAVGGEVPDGPVAAVFHPRTVALHRRAPEGSARNVWSGTLLSLERLGDHARVRVDIGRGEGSPLIVVAEVTQAAANDLALDQGGPVWMSVKATEVSAYPR